MRIAITALLVLGAGCPGPGGAPDAGREIFVVGTPPDDVACVVDDDCPLGATCVEARCRVVDFDVDNDGYEAAVDCDDQDAEVHPGAAEVCDDVDQDCDGAADDGARNACGVCGPVLAEICNLVDDDCDDLVDEECGGGDVAEREPNDGAAGCQAIALPPAVGETIVLHGAFDPPGDVDSYCFFVRAGTGLVFDVDSVVLGAPTDGVLGLFAGSGEPIPGGFNDYADGPDPRVALDFDFDGNVRLDVYDFYPDRGGPDAVYELRISATAVVQCTDADLDGVGVCDGDCDDDDALIFPGQSEQCDGEDDSCDGDVDEGCPVISRAEAEPNETTSECALHTLPFTVEGVIDPRKDKDVYCFFVADGAEVSFDVDAEEPPFGSLLNSRLRLLAMGDAVLATNDDGADPDTGFTATDSDSHLIELFERPGLYAIQVSDESTLAGGSRLTYALHARYLIEPGCVDGDVDGVATCEGDCADDDPNVHFGAPEICDGQDNDCDGLADPATCTGDFDGDGFAGGAGDCDDADARRKPGATEICNLLDDDCDGEPDEGVQNACGGCGHPPRELCGDQIDNDCDGTTDDDCDDDVDGDLVTPNDGDCDDAAAAVKPSATEACNGVDDDCDGLVDEHVKNSCGECAEEPVELCDGLDNDCDGLVDDGAVNLCGTCGPAPPEVCDGDDDNCDGVADDGVTNACGQCGALPREACDGVVDDDCDESLDEGCDDDGDDDGVTPRQGDCDDGAPAIHAGATETCDGAIDHDCDGRVDDGCPQPVESEDNATIATCDAALVPGVIGGTIITAADQDVFCVVVEVAGTVLGFDVDAQENGSPLNAALDLFDPLGTQIATNNSAATDPDTGMSSADPYISFTFDDPGTYAVRVRDQGATGGATATYVLDVRVEGGCVDLDGDAMTTCQGDCDDFNASIHPGAVDVCDGVDQNCVGGADELCVDGCLDDGREQNDTAPAAAAVAAGAVTDLMFCRGDADYYAIPLTAGEQVSVTALFQHVDGDLTLELLRPNGSVLDTSATATNNEAVSGTAATTGTHYALVTGPFDVEVPYELTIVVTPVAP